MDFKIHVKHIFNTLVPPFPTFALFLQSLTGLNRKNLPEIIKQSVIFFSEFSRTAFCFVDRSTVEFITLKNRSQ